MNKTIFALMLLTAILIFGNTANAQTSSSSPALLRHIVIISFKQDAPADSIKALDNIYAGLAKSSFVKDFEMGVNISARDTTVLKHIYMTSFASKDDMDNYKKIPEYSRLFKTSLAVAGDVTVADYWAIK